MSSIIATARAYDDERKRAEALAEIDRAKTQFFSNVSHEFRTPLTLMLGPIEDALEASPPPEHKDRLELAHRNAQRLLKLVNSLLDFSRIEAGRATAAFEPVDLAGLTAELASNFRSACERAGLELVVDCPPLRQPVFVDRDMWEKIVLNLLSNAFKFTFAGRIEVRLRETERAAVLTVRDTGVGIPDAEMPRLFERFHRIEGQPSRTFEGSGIGLALVQELARQIGGEISAESRVGEGTAFSVTVPLGHGHLAPDRIRPAPASDARPQYAHAYVEEAMSWLPDADVPTTGIRADLTEDSAGEVGIDDHVRVLIADDNADMRAYLRRLLDDRCEVETVADGAAAWRAIRARKPDLLITDVMMPVLDGVGLVDRIRNDPDLSDLSVIMLSARAGEESRLEGVAAGADDYLAKPFSARDLLARVRANIKLARVRRQGEDQLKAFLAASFDAVYRMSADWTVMRHLEGKDFIATTAEPDTDWIDKYIHPDDQAQVRAAIQAAIASKSVFQLEHRVIRPDGSLGWTSSRAAPLLDATGEIVEWVGTAADVTERKQYEERQTLLLNELNHRVKNTLAAVQSIAAQTLRDAPPEGRQALQARLMALAAAHDVLTRRQWEGADIREVIDGALAAYRSDEQEGRFSLDGPDIRLVPKAALALALALHELATNAAKYGALSTDTGTVRLQWSVSGDPARFSFRWRESGGPPVVAPARRGFGSRLIERGLAQDLDGRIELVFDPAGVVCSIDAPAGELTRDFD